MSIKRIREYKKLSQKQVAEAINVSQQMFNNYENGKSRPSIETLIALANFFDVSIDELVGRDISYLLDKQNFTTTQLELIKKIKYCSDLTCEKVSAYIDGLNKK